MNIRKAGINFSSTTIPGENSKMVNKIILTIPRVKLQI
jgi:hypothetical protein